MDVCPLLRNLKYLLPPTSMLILCLQILSVVSSIQEGCLSSEYVFLVPQAKFSL